MSYAPQYNSRSTPRNHFLRCPLARDRELYWGGHSSRILDDALALTAPPPWDLALVQQARDSPRGRGTRVALFREMFGDPFRPVVVDAFWLTPTVLVVARETYRERRYQDLPILADALEERGCANAALLAHLRGAGPHTFGCWALYTLLNMRSPVAAGEKPC